VFVLAPPRPRRFRRSVSRRLIGAADRPVLVADAAFPEAA
jgi:hypothetical protein